MIGKEGIYRFEEERVPEFNLIERTKRLFHMLRMVTSPNKIRGEGDKERPVALRRKRKELLDNLTKLRKNRDKMDKASYKEEIFNTAYEAKARDEIAHQYLNQSEVKVGGETSRYVRLEPPKSRIKEELSHLPPIVLIPGISNDIDPVGTLAQEIAFSGREVYVIAYPESTLGSVSAEFVGKTEEDGFKAHADFFKGAINQIIDGDKKFSIWSHSTGGPISAEMLSGDPEFSDRVENAVLIAPASSDNMGGGEKRGMAKLTYSVLKEVARALTKAPDMAKYSLVMPSGDDDDKGQKDLKDRVFKSLISKIIKKSDKFAAMKVSGKVVVWSGSQDSMTSSHKSHKEFRANGAKTILKRWGMHLTALTNPETVLPAIHEEILN